MIATNKHAFADPDPTIITTQLDIPTHCEIIDITMNLSNLTDEQWLSLPFPEDVIRKAAAKRSATHRSRLDPKVLARVREIFAQDSRPTQQQIADQLNIEFPDHPLGPFRKFQVSHWLTKTLRLRRSERVSFEVREQAREWYKEGLTLPDIQAKLEGIGHHVSTAAIYQWINRIVV